ncbi:MAG: hypothetical protein IJV75_02285, partial [Alphaproteobacteria bacterium]|nr:hypothetical protein [Alphaproteobacteria bacterium]
MRNKLETSKVLEQKGRSLVELLGVLAVAGVLSVAGLYGFGYAMEKWRENETLDRYAKVVAGARTSRILEDENEGYHTKYFVDGINHTLRDAFERQHVDIKKVISNVGDDDDYADGDRPLGYLLAPQKGPFNQFNPKPDDDGYELPEGYEPKEVEIWVDVRTPSAFTVHARNLTLNTCKRIVQSNLGHNWGYESTYDDFTGTDADEFKGWYTAPQLHNDAKAEELCKTIVLSNGGKELVLWFGDTECISGTTCPKPPRPMPPQPMCPSGNESPECDDANPCGDDEYCSDGCCYSNGPDPIITEVDECPSGTTLCVGIMGTDCCEADEYCDNGICKGTCPSGNPVPECGKDAECGKDEICKAGCCINNKCDGKPICSSNAECPTGYSCSAEGCCEEICDGRPTCKDDEDCGGGEKCEAGCCEFFCEYCTEDANCGSGYVCEDNCCEPDHTCDPCKTDDECGSGEACVNECCVEQECTPPKCKSNEDCGENYVCKGGCCIDNGCDACTTDEDCSLGLSCNYGCCGAKPFRECPEGVTPCESAKDCASGEMCNSGCCEKMECPSEMECETDYDCVVSEEVAKQNNWKTQGKCNATTKCCQMLNCEEDKCGKLGMDTLYNGTCCPKSQSWFNCGGCMSNPTYIDECGIERTYAKACCSAPSDAPAGCTGTGEWCGKYSASSAVGKKEPACYKNYPDSGNSCCELACLSEDGSSTVCCNQLHAVAGVCCMGDPQTGNTETAHCCGGFGGAWAATADDSEGRTGTCCGANVPGGIGVSSEPEAYIEYPETDIEKTQCVPLGYELTCSNLDKQKTTVSCPVSTAKTYEYCSGIVCPKGETAYLAEDTSGALEHKPDCCAQGSTVQSDSGGKQDGFTVGKCCTAQEQGFVDEKGHANCCPITQSLATSTNGSGSKCCPVGEKGFTNYYGDAECCPSNQSLAASTNGSGSKCCPVGETGFTDQYGDANCCPSNQSLATSTNGSGSICCAVGENGDTKSDGSAVCCPTGQQWNDAAGMCLEETTSPVYTSETETVSYSTSPGGIISSTPDGTPISTSSDGGVHNSDTVSTTYTGTETSTGGAYTESSTPSVSDSTPMTETSTSDVSTQTLTLLTETTAPAMTETSTPSMTETTVPPVSTSDTTMTESTPMTETSTPAMTETSTPSMTETSTPAMTETSTPSMTETITSAPTTTTESTPMTETTAPAMTETSTPAMTETSTPSMTETITSAPT